MSSSSLLAGAVDTLVADSVKGRRVVVSPIGSGAAAVNASAGSYTEAAGAGARVISTTAARTGSLFFVTPANAGAAAAAAAAGWIDTIVDGVSFTLNTGANGVYNWWIVSPA